MSTYLRVKEHLDKSRANYMQRTHAERMREAVNVAVLSEAKAEIERMMGWPIGHTDLKPLETDRLEEWYRWHGVS